MTPTGHAGYKNVMANATDDKEKILLMLYKGALTFVRLARRGIEENSPKIRGENISKVLAILTELNCALDRKAGGDLAENLADLYRYLMNRLTVANIKNDPEPLNEVERLLGELYHGFEGAAGKKEEADTPAPTESIKQTMDKGIGLLAV